MSVMRQLGHDAENGGKGKDPVLASLPPNRSRFNVIPDVFGEAWADITQHGVYDVRCCKLGEQHARLFADGFEGGLETAKGVNYRDYSSVVRLC